MPAHRRRSKRALWLSCAAAPTKSAPRTRAPLRRLASRRGARAGSPRPCPPDHCQALPPGVRGQAGKYRIVTR
eukprot:2311964-Alexandrium_andersonii.AAC.1